MGEESSVYYGKEPFDLRLMVLRMIRNLPMIIGVTLLGTLLFGGGYYVKNVLLYDEVQYTVTSTYQVSYVDEPSKSGDYYINDMTWNTYVHSKEFLDAVWEYLQEESKKYSFSNLASTQQLETVISARLDSDIHVPCTVVTATSPELTLMIAQSVEQTMVGEFAEGNEQVASIEVIDPALVAEEVVPDVRPMRAFVLSGVLSFFFVVVILLLKEIGEDAIWLPATIRRRYGLTVLGTIHSAEGRVNFDYCFEKSVKIAVCAIDERVNPVEVSEALRRPGADKEYVSVPAPLVCPEACQAMREADGVLLVVRAGKGAGRALEYHLEYCRTQQITVTAALLWDADEWLIRAYYMLPEFAEKQDKQQKIVSSRK